MKPLPWTLISFAVAGWSLSCTQPQVHQLKDDGPQQELTSDDVANQATQALELSRVKTFKEMAQQIRSQRIDLGGEETVSETPSFRQRLQAARSELQQDVLQSSTTMHQAYIKKFEKGLEDVTKAISERRDLDETFTRLSQLQTNVGELLISVNRMERRSSGVRASELRTLQVDLGHLLSMIETAYERIQEFEEVLELYINLQQLEATAQAIVQHSQAKRRIYRAHEGSTTEFVEDSMSELDAAAWIMNLVEKIYESPERKMDRDEFRNFLSIIRQHRPVFIPSEKALLYLTEDKYELDDYRQQLHDKRMSDRRQQVTEKLVQLKLVGGDNWHVSPVLGSFAVSGYAVSQVVSTKEDGLVFAGIAAVVILADVVNSLNGYGDGNSDWGTMNDNQAQVNPSILTSNVGATISTASLLRGDIIISVVDSLSGESIFNEQLSEAAQTLNHLESAFANHSGSYADIDQKNRVVNALVMNYGLGEREKEIWLEKFGKVIVLGHGATDEELLDPAGPFQIDPTTQELQILHIHQLMNTFNGRD